MIVFRIEHRVDALGPYKFYSMEPGGGVRPVDEDGFIGSVHNATKKRHNRPHIEMLEEFRCGFNSIEQMKRWFPRKWLIKLARHDFVLSIYEVPEAYEDSRQVVFDINTATKIGQRGILSV